MKPATEKLIEQIANCKVGDKIETSMVIEGHSAKPVSLHCTETLSEALPKTGHWQKKFSVFSHGVEVAQVQATKIEGEWRPR